MSLFRAPSQTEICHVASEGYVVLEEIAAAERLQAWLDEVSILNLWHLALTGREGPMEISSQELGRQTPRQIAQLQESIRRQSRRGFSYVYQRHDMAPGTEPLRELATFLGSDGFVEWMRGLTASAELVRADMHLTCYRPGHFLRVHDDTYTGRQRRYAYVLHLSQQWQPDWGGLLHMRCGEHDWKTLLPKKNSLHVFEVPREHFVSQVASYATQPRFAVTGWLFAD